MNAEQLAESASNGGNPPEGLSDTLKAMWLARAGKWHESHDMCQDGDDPIWAWIHAHLHRIEGDLMNAGYWYARAGKSQPEGQAGLGEEWLEIVEELLGA